MQACCGSAAKFFIAEVCIDIIKHAVLGKFNEIRPGVYREFLKVSALPLALCFAHRMARCSLILLV